MSKLMNLSNEAKKEYAIVAVIYFISITVGILVGNNTEWFQPAFAMAGFMAGSTLTCMLLFTIYNLIDSMTAKKKSA